ncbi:hypothetical protein CcaCcLH18_08150 [Colletotrichum camelliae]|nr:hypothetical protein CcaCcLH18_08150 [Colletotrichum camelliae]
MTSLFNLADLEAALPDITQPQYDCSTQKNMAAKKSKARSFQTSRERKKPKTYGGIKKAQKKKQDKQLRRFNQPSQRVMSTTTFTETLEVALPVGFTHPDDNTITNIITDTVARNLSSTLRLHRKLLVDIPRIHAFAFALFDAMNYQAEIFNAIGYQGEDLRGDYFSEVAQIVRRDGVTGGGMTPEAFSMASISDDACDKMHQYFVTSRDLYLRTHGPADSGFSGSTYKTKLLIRMVDLYMSRMACVI